MAISRSSGDAAGPCRRDAAVAWRPAALLSQQPGLPRGGRAAGGGDRRTVRAPSGARDSARGQRVRLSRAGVLLRRVGTGVSRLAEGTIRVDRRPQSGMGDGFLVAALFGLGGDHPSSANPDMAESVPAAGLHALFLRRAARVLRTRAQSAEPAHT